MATSKLQALATTLASISLYSCIDGPQPFSQNGNQATTYVVVSGDESNVSGAFSATSSNEQVLKVESISSLNGTSLAIPAGALSGNTVVSVTEGSSIVHSGSLSSLNVAGASGGPAVVIKSSAAKNTVSAMTLQIPVNSSSSLALGEARDFDKMVVMFKADDSEEADRKLGIIPRSELSLVENRLVEFSTKRFGSYQVAFLETVVRKAIEIKTKEEIIAKKEESLESFKIDIPTIEIKVGDTTVLEATGLFNDGSERKVAKLLSWSSVNPRILSTKGNNEFRALTEGQAEVRATDKNKKVEKIILKVLPKSDGGTQPPNTPPTLALGTTSGVTVGSGTGNTAADRKIYTVQENVPGSIQLVGADAENDSLVYSCSNLGFSTLAVASGLLSINSGDIDSGATLDIDCKVATPANAQHSATMYLQIYVTPVNDAPTLSLAAPELRVDITNFAGVGTAATPFTFEVVVANYRPAKIPLVVSDIDSGTTTLSCGSIPTWVQLVMVSTGNFELRFTPEGPHLLASGSATISCVANDGFLNSTALTFRPNFIDPPALAFLLHVNNGNLGGTEGADFQCRNAATATSFQGLNFKAVLTGNYQRLTDRIRINGPVYLASSFANGTPIKIADDFADFTDNNFDSPLNTGITGTTSSDTMTFSGLRDDSGSYIAPANGYNCRNWSTISSSVFGKSGTVNSTTATLYTGSALACNTSGSIICVSQPGAPSLLKFNASPGPTAGEIAIEYQVDSATLTRTSGIEIRMAQGNIAPSSCFSGTSAATITSINASLQTMTITGLATTANYSFLACTKDNTNQVVPDRVLLNVPARPTAIVAFATTNAYAPNLGVPQFDAACATEAGGSSFTQISTNTSNFKALVSTSTENAIDRIHIDLPVINANLGAAVSLTPLFRNDEFWFMTSKSIGDRDGSVVASQFFWTGTGAGGIVNTSNTCSDWTSISSGVNGKSGQTTAAAVNPLSSGAHPCSTTTNRLLCIGRAPLP